SSARPATSSTTATANAPSHPSSPPTSSSANSWRATSPPAVAATSAGWTSPTPPTARPAPACRWPSSTASAAPSPAAATPARAGVLVSDRAFCSYAPLALCRRRGLHGLFRAHQRSLISFRPRRRHAPRGGAAAAGKGLPRSRWLRRLGRRDQVVEYAKPDDKP